MRPKTDVFAKDRRPMVDSGSPYVITPHSRTREIYIAQLRDSSGARGIARIPLQRKEGHYAPKGGLARSHFPPRRSPEVPNVRSAFLKLDLGERPPKSSKYDICIIQNVRLKRDAISLEKKL